MFPKLVLVCQVKLVNVLTFILANDANGCLKPMQLVAGSKTAHLTCLTKQFNDLSSLKPAVVP